MTGLTKAVLVGLLAVAAQSRLVVYGPQELKDKFEFAGKENLNDD
jgi:hypothetical protein